MSRKNADVQISEIDSSVWWKRKRSDRVLSLRRIWKTGAKGQGPCSSSSSICPFAASAFFRFRSIPTIFFLIIPIDHQSISTRLTKFLRKNPFNVDRIFQSFTHSGMFVECFVSAVEQIDLRIEKLRIVLLVDASIFRTEISKTRIDREWHFVRFPWTYSAGARSEENSQWKMRMFLFVGSFNSIGWRKYSS